MNVIWAPQAGPQASLIDCPVYEILYGGARGGGKTDGVLGKYAIKAALYGAAFNGVVFRKEVPQADDLWERAKEIFGGIGAQSREDNKSIRLPDGGRLRLRPLENVKDAEKYQGQNLTDVWIEEAGNYPDPAPIQRLHATLRGVPWKQMILTGNPGGPGQHWIKRRYIDPAPRGMEILEETFRYQGPTGWHESSRERVFIPAKVWDNKVLLANDPDYVANLHLVGSEALVKAWLDGDWNVIQGAFYDCWSERMIVKPFRIPDHWMRFRSMDWGSASPFSIGWWATATEPVRSPCGQTIPKRALVRYREWYGAREPNVGLKMDAEKVGAGIPKRQAKDEEIQYHVADPSMFNQDGGPSIARRCYENCDDVSWKPADNNMVARKGHMSGLDQMRARMVGDGDGHPMIFTFDTCTDSIRTIPALQHDDKQPEKIADGEDHAADEWRYACMSRPWTAAKPPEKRKMTSMANVTLDRLWEDQHA